MNELWTALEGHFAALGEKLSTGPKKQEEATANNTAPAPAEKKTSKLKDIIKKKKEKEKAEGKEQQPVLESVQDHSVPKPPPRTCNVTFTQAYSKELPMLSKLVEARVLTAPQVSAKRLVEASVAFKNQQGSMV